jgi:hypothetical protein
MDFSMNSVVGKKLKHFYLKGLWLNNKSFLSLITAVFLLSGTIWAQEEALSATERIAIRVDNISVSGIPIRFTKNQIFIKVGEQERSYPAFALSHFDMYKFRKALCDGKKADDFFELGKYCLEKGMKKEAELELMTAARLDEANFGKKVKDLLGGEKQTQDSVKPEEKIGTEKPEANKVVETRELEKKEVEKKENNKGEDDGEFVVIKLPDGRQVKVPAQFAPSARQDKAPTKEEIESFKEKRLKELQEKVRGGDPWKMEETKNYRVWSNLPADRHRMVVTWAENLFQTMSGIMGYKEGDPLWHDKCDVYFFARHRQFQTFAVEIDRGMPNSGGYFSHRGRRVHIAIPFNDMFSGENLKTQMAANTLYHEGTHAFLQLVGNNVYISRWLHEGMAQLIEFVMDPKNDGKKRTRNTLVAAVQQGQLMNWAQSKERPAGGTDGLGYAIAWSRIRFLYEKNRLGIPKMIKLIKDGKSDEQAMEEIFGANIEQLEKEWENWLNVQMKNAFPSLK